MKRLKLGWLVNSRLGVPALSDQAEQGNVAALAIQDLDHEINQQVRQIAGRYSIPLTTLSKSLFHEQLEQWIRDLRPDAVFVFACSFKIPAPLLHLPKSGFLNFHFSLLPQYRGPQSIFWEMRNREPFGGISIHQMNEKFDEGPMILQEKIAINPEETYGMYYSRLGYEGIRVTRSCIALLSSETVTMKEQDKKAARYYPRPGFNDLLINWSSDMDDIKALVNAGNPWNKGAIAYIKGWGIRIAEVTGVQDNNIPAYACGTILQADPKQGVWVKGADHQAIRIDTVCLEEGIFNGARLCRFGIKAGDRFEIAPPNTPPPSK